VKAGRQGRAAQAEEGGPEEADKFPGTGNPRLKGQDAPSLPAKTREKGGLVPRQAVKGFGIFRGKGLAYLVVEVEGGDQGRGFTLQPHREGPGRAGPDFPGNGFYGPGDVFPGKGGEKSPPRLQYGGAAVNTAEFQGEGPEFGPAYPQGRRQGKGARSQIRHPVPRGKGQIQAGEEAAEAVEVPGKEVTEIGGKQGRPVKVGEAPLVPGAGEEPGEFRHVSGKIPPETAGHREGFFD
jgi:hypothetical protein